MAEVKVAEDALEAAKAAGDVEAIEVAEEEVTKKKRKAVKAKAKHMHVAYAGSYERLAEPGEPTGELETRVVTSAAHDGHYRWPVTIEITDEELGTLELDTTTTATQDHSDQQDAAAGASAGDAGGRSRAQLTPTTILSRCISLLLLLCAALPLFTSCSSVLLSPVYLLLLSSCSPPVYLLLLCPALPLFTSCSSRLPLHCSPAAAVAPPPPPLHCSAPLCLQ